ncbi:MAG: pyruvate carboxylase subunit B, partial [Vulcanimicrobiaceae bacterium]
PLPGTRERLRDLGAEGFARWMREQPQLLVTDTTFRDAHQSLLATRVRSIDLLRIAPSYAGLLPNLFSLECWGGATFDVAMRFLHEDPWARLRGLRAAVPNVLLQMLLRGANAVGYTAYPENVVRAFIAQAAAAGIDLFRIFDSLNDPENMRVAIDAVRQSGALCEVALCYTGDLLDPSRPTYDLAYYLRLARTLEAAGAQILGIKDMAGLLRPEAARRLVRALREETGLPVHLHTHDTAGNGIATVLAAGEAGVDAADAATDAMSALFSQPSLGALVAALAHTPRATGLDPAAIDALSNYWETVRAYYRPFEAETRAPSAAVYVHEIPGGQYTNLREQAQAMGLGGRWGEVLEAYATVNRLFGDIVKVTPTSKVVGDMALFMVGGDLDAEAVLDPDRPLAFPQSVVAFFRGELGRPPNGFPPALARKVLGDEAPPLRSAPPLAPRDLVAVRAELAERIGRAPSEDELQSYLMYPSVLLEFARHVERFGEVGVLETPTFFYGMNVGDEIAVELERGVTLIVRYAALGEPDERGERTVYFELNGQPRPVAIADRHAVGLRPPARRAEPGNPAHVAAPMPGQVVTVSVAEGRPVRAGEALLTIEAMKMQSVLHAPRDGVVVALVVPVGGRVAAGDLLVELAPPAPVASAGAPAAEPSTSPMSEARPPRKARR